MKATDVRAFLEGTISGRELHSRVAAEAGTWAERLRERGRSAPISLVGEIGPLDMSLERVVLLLDALIRTELSPASFAYVLDALLLSDKVRWTREAAREQLEHLVIPDKGRIDMAHAWQARERLAAMKMK